MRCSKSQAKATDLVNYCDSVAHCTRAPIRPEVSTARGRVGEVLECSLPLAKVYGSRHVIVSLLRVAGLSLRRAFALPRPSWLLGRRQLGVAALNRDRPAIGNLSAAWATFAVLAGAGGLLAGLLSLCHGYHLLSAPRSVSFLAPARASSTARAFWCPNSYLVPMRFYNHKM